MKIIAVVLLTFVSNLVFSQSLASVENDLLIEPIDQDSIHSSMVLSVDYKRDTLFVKARHFSICCEKFVNHIEVKEDLSQVNLVVKNLETGCLCKSEKIILHTIYAKEIGSEVKLRINGKKPKYGVDAYHNPNFTPKKKKKFKM